MPQSPSFLTALPEKYKKGPAPVHLWNPAYCGEMDLRIARDGIWYHEGTPIGRPAMVQLFASILKYEDGRYFLVTPVEKLGIKVDDVPFIAVDFTVQGEGPTQDICFVTNVADEVTADADHKIFLHPATDEPYIHIRAGLNARIDRKSFYRLAEYGRHHDHGGQKWFGLWSKGKFFPLINSDKMAL